MLLMPHVLIPRHPKPTILGSLALSPIIDYNKLSLSVNDRLNMKKKNIERHCSWGHWVPWVVSLWQKRPTSATYQGILKRRSLISMLQKEGRKKTSCFQHSLCFSDLPCQASLLPFFFDVKTIKWNEIWYKILLFKRKISRWNSSNIYNQMIINFFLIFKVVFIYIKIYVFT